MAQRRDFDGYTVTPENVPTDILTTKNDAPWMARGACIGRDPAIFSVDKASNAQRARAVCITECPVSLTCLKYAIDNELDGGIWGGTTPLERRRMAKRGTIKVPTLERAHDVPRTCATCGETRVLRRDQCRSCRRVAEQAADAAMEA